MTDLGGKTSIFSHPVYLFLREFSLQDFRGGSVQTNSARCIGCQSCVSACPFGMITIQSLPGDTRQQIVKCDLCEQREEGPACVESCPTQALQLLTERELRRVRQQRIVASGENPL
ncbi:4Fe-4S dicluster domain-containing protein [Escherichia coli]|uniref:4Fe-4S dicluster domain-containing protein n=1 Tax=Escherichia coli TaxID=562 RepID=UPI0024E21A60|nr:4Fe-4S dicluster domain-containing protein [Escherichia coli]